MSRKHVQQYYEQILRTRAEFLKDGKELEEACKNNMIDSSVLENHKNRWTYMMYLLNMPNKKEKKKSYEKRNKEKIDGISDKYKDDYLINKGKSK